MLFPRRACSIEPPPNFSQEQRARLSRRAEHKSRRRIHRAGESGGTGNQKQSQSKLLIPLP